MASRYEREKAQRIADTIRDEFGATDEEISRAMGSVLGEGEYSLNHEVATPDQADRVAGALRQLRTDRQVRPTESLLNDSGKDEWSWRPGRSRSFPADPNNPVTRDLEEQGQEFVSTSDRKHNRSRRW